jgi:hypothetical protein
MNMPSSMAAKTMLCPRKGIFANTYPHSAPTSEDTMVAGITICRLLRALGASVRHAVSRPTKSIFFGSSHMWAASACVVGLRAAMIMM